MQGPYFVGTDPRFRQGDILRDVTVVSWASINADEIELLERNYQYCVVLSQECDLEHDFNNRFDDEKRSRAQDKFLTSLLLCPAYIAADVKSGTHLEASQMRMQQIGRDDFKKIQQNNNYRYHHLPENQELQLPNLVIDFKHYLTIPTEIAYKDAFRDKVIASLGDLFREHLSGRFAHYLSRIGLPEIETAA